MGFISKLGKWLDTRFPEKISTEEVIRSLQAYHDLQAHVILLQEKLIHINEKMDAFSNGARAFDKEINLLKDDMNKAKVLLALKNQQMKSPTMNGSEAWKR